MYLDEGNYAEAAISLLSMIPLPMTNKAGKIIFATAKKGTKEGLTLVQPSGNVPGGTSIQGFEAPKVIVNSRGQLTNGRYTIDSAGMAKHTTGSTTSGKSQFLYRVDADTAVLDAAAYADKYKLWKPGSRNPADFTNKAKVPVIDGNVGVTGSGELTNYINIYRTKTNFVHGSPGNPVR